MRYSEISVTEDEENIDRSNLLGIKQEILDRLENISLDKEGRRTLQRVQDILDRGKATDAINFYAQKVKSIGLSDTDVQQAVDQLTQLVAAAAQSTSTTDRDFFFKLWENDRIVKVDELLRGGRVYKMKELFNFYGKSRAVTYVVNSLAKDAGYGLGKGELLLAVLSKRIRKSPSKGDLIIDDQNIEVKATHGGSPRFADQEVRVAQGYEQVRDQIIQKYRQQIDQVGGLARTGLNLKQYTAVGQLPNIDKKQFRADTQALLGKIFPDQNNSEILNAIVSGNANQALQLFGEQTYNRYMEIKNDDAVLYINLAAKDQPTYVLFRTVDDLTKMGLKFKVGTAYILGASGNRDVYPQTGIVSF